MTAALNHAVAMSYSHLRGQQLHDTLLLCSCVWVAGVVHNRDDVRTIFGIHLFHSPATHKKECVAPQVDEWCSHMAEQVHHMCQPQRLPRSSDQSIGGKAQRPGILKKPTHMPWQRLIHNHDTKSQAWPYSRLCCPRLVFVLTSGSRPGGGGGGGFGLNRQKINAKNKKLRHYKK